MFRKILIIISIAIFITACGDDEAAGFDPAKHVRPIKTYKVTSVKRMDVRTYPGKIRAGKKVDTSFILSGSLVVLNVKEGDYVEKGSLIAKLDDASYKHNLNTIKAQVEEATLAFQRAKNFGFPMLYQKRTTTKQSLLMMFYSLRKSLLKRVCVIRRFMHRSRGI